VPQFVKRLGGTFVESRLAGPGSDSSEVLAVGVEPVAPDCRVAPGCPPGLAAWRRSSAVMTRQTWSANRRLRQLFASRGTFSLRTPAYVRCVCSIRLGAVWTRLRPDAFAP